MNRRPFDDEDDDSGLALQYASEALRDDRRVCLTAVHVSGLALAFCSQRLRDDRGVVLVAVRREGTSLQFASRRLRGDRALAFAAVRSNIQRARARPRGRS